ncbi:MAG: hypothetical protein RR715_04935 [Comamonas sp.]
MAQEYFDPLLFIKEGETIAVNLLRTPFFCNIGGRPQYFKEPPAGVRLLEPASSDSDVAIGREYRVTAATTTQPSPQYGDQTQLEFLADRIEYEPLYATREIAAAFGMTLVEESQGVRVSSPESELEQIDYEYGMFAGHMSPYQGTGYRLLGVVCTDLEHHNFPHVFASVDPQLPLVISVGRYWPELQKICLADLWVPRGKALYVPPRPKLKCQPCLDLHGNRNSALACWKGIGQASVKTQTLLQTKGAYFHWFWNDLPSNHPLLT